MTRLTLALCFCLSLLSVPIARVAEADPAARAGRATQRVLRVVKSERVMIYEEDGEVVRRFTIALGFAPVGDKAKRGDGRTPEGSLYVAWKNSRSQFHRFLGLSYPMPYHAERAAAAGELEARTLASIRGAVGRRSTPPQNTSLGGAVGIHGGGAGADWTLGCIAVTDDEIEWLFERVRVGDRVLIEP